MALTESEPFLTLCNKLWNLRSCFHQFCTALPKKLERMTCSPSRLFLGMGSEKVRGVGSKTVQRPSQRDRPRSPVVVACKTEVSTSLLHLRRSAVESSVHCIGGLADHSLCSFSLSTKSQGSFSGIRQKSCLERSLNVGDLELHSENKMIWKKIYRANVADQLLCFWAKPDMVRR